MSEWALRDGILDAIKDDGESIVQIEEYLTHLEIRISREIVIKEIISLIEDGCVYIRFPDNLDIEDFRKCDDLNVGDFWFELTQKGLSEWEKIVV